MAAASIKPGEKVVDPTHPGEFAVVREGPEWFGGAAFYVVRLANGEEALYEGKDLLRPEVDTSSPVSWLLDRPLVDPDRFARFMTHLKLTSELTDIVYSYRSTKTAFRVHQFKPVMKAIEAGEARLLLADEVGLGKTIEAGLVWSELHARTPLDRVLVLCSSGLRGKWRMEMRRRFDFDLALINGAEFLEFVDRYAEVGDRARLHGVASFAQLRSDAVLEALSTRAPTFDLVIVDEAHAMRNPTTRTHQLGELLGANTAHLLLLSATPVNLGSDDLFHLLSLIRPDEFSSRDLFDLQLEPVRHINRAARMVLGGVEPSEVVKELESIRLTWHGRHRPANPVLDAILAELTCVADQLAPEGRVRLHREIQSLNQLSSAYTRTRKRELPDENATRRPRVARVEWTPTERALHDAALDLVRDLQNRTTGRAPGLAVVMPARQATSCLPVMGDYLAEILRNQELRVDLDEAEEDDPEWTTAGRSAELTASESARRALRLWEQLRGIDTKFDVLLHQLFDLRAEGSSQFLIFSFFRRTLAYLEERLDAAGFVVGLMDGSVPISDRERLIEQFRNGDIDILLSSEVGAEGLDFQFCDVIVNYDLPWNPMRLEQRIGRLDRFGQESDVIHIVNFEIPGTIDTEIFGRLYDRIAIFENSIGELEPILGKPFRTLQRDMSRKLLTAEERQERLRQIEDGIAREQQELERFEQARQQLVGLDDFLEESLRDRDRRGRLLTPTELRRYVAGFLADHAAGSRLAKGQAAGSFVFTGSPALADLLRANADRSTLSDLSALLPAIESGSSHQVTFEADADTRAELLTLRHPLVKTIAAYYSAEPSDSRLHRGGFVRLVDAEHEGRWIFFVYLLTASGLRPSSSLFAVASNTDSGDVSVAVGDAVMAHLASPEPAGLPEADVPIVTDSEVRLTYASCGDAILAEKRRLEDDLTRSTAAAVAARIGSLQRALDVRVARINEMAAAPGTNERIARMRRAQARNLESDILGEIRQLEESKTVTVGFKPVAGGLAIITRA